MRDNLLVAPYSYDRSTCVWTCCECGSRLNERRMSIILPRTGTWWLSKYDEPDWVCESCISEAAGSGCSWYEYCKDCWHVMEHTAAADFHALPSLCPLTRKGSQDVNDLRP